MTRNECIAAVKQVFPGACAVYTVASTAHYRIWPTSDFFETRVIGKGRTEGGAWKNAFDTLEKSKRELYGKF
jgi:hypothetical protein